ncbi:hypothetical protein KEM52_000914, partial [Ascosphaera acerosa]
QQQQQQVTMTPLPPVPYNPHAPRPVEAYTLPDDLNASIAADLRAQFQCDEQGRVLFFSTPPLDVVGPSAASPGLTVEGGRAHRLEHSAAYLAVRAELRVRRKRRRLQLQMQSRSQTESQAQREGGGGPDERRRKTRADGRDRDRTAESTSTDRRAASPRSASDADADADAAPVSIAHAHAQREFLARVGLPAVEQAAASSTPGIVPFEPVLDARPAALFLQRCALPSSFSRISTGGDDLSAGPAPLLDVAGTAAGGARRGVVVGRLGAKTW